MPSGHYLYTMRIAMPVGVIPLARQPARGVTKEMQAHVLVVLVTPLLGDSRVLSQARVSQIQRRPR